MLHNGKFKGTPTYPTILNCRGSIGNFVCFDQSPFMWGIVGNLDIMNGY